jgi:hypothetical protein
VILLDVFSTWFWRLLDLPLLLSFLDLLLGLLKHVPEPDLKSLGTCLEPLDVSGPESPRDWSAKHEEDDEDHRWPHEAEPIRASHAERLRDRLNTLAPLPLAPGGWVAPPWFWSVATPSGLLVAPHDGDALLPQVVLQLPRLLGNLHLRVGGLADAVALELVTGGAENLEIGGFVSTTKDDWDDMVELEVTGAATANAPAAVSIPNEPLHISGYRCPSWRLTVLHVP